MSTHLQGLHQAILQTRSYNSLSASMTSQAKFMKRVQPIMLAKGHKISVSQCAVKQIGRCKRPAYILQSGAINIHSMHATYPDVCTWLRIKQTHVFSKGVYIAGLGVLPELNTLILKQNQVKDLGDSLHGCTALAKLSVAHNK